MKNIQLHSGIAVALLAMGVIVSSAMAHHSSAQFDLSERGRREVSGVVKKFEWANPHAWIWLDIPMAEGKTQTWGFEMASPGSLRSSGMNWNTLKKGDKITVEYGPARDGSHVGVLAGKIVLADGTVWYGKGTASPVRRPELGSAAWGEIGKE